MNSARPPTSLATRWGMILLSQRAISWNSFRTARVRMRITAATARVIGTIRSQTDGLMLSIPKISRTSFCQPTWRQIDAAATKPTTTTVTPRTTF